MLKTSLQRPKSDVSTAEGIQFISLLQLQSQQTHTALSDTSNKHVF